MRDPLARKQHRQRALLRLVAERRLATQAQLARALRGAGFPATQATISRDIVELGLVKIARDGTHAYSAPAGAPRGRASADRLRRFCEDYPVEASAAGNLVVLRSLPGTASALGAALDGAGLEQIVGTIAGDDTVFVAVSGRRPGALLTRLAAFGVATGGRAQSAGATGGSAVNGDRRRRRGQ